MGVTCQRQKNYFCEFLLNFPLDYQFKNFAEPFHPNRSHFKLFHQTHETWQCTDGLTEFDNTVLADSVTLEFVVLRNIIKETKRFG